MVEVRVSQQETSGFAWTQMELDEAELAQLLAKKAVVADVADVIGGADMDTSADWLPVRELNVVEWALRTNPDYRYRLLATRAGGQPQRGGLSGRRDSRGVEPCGGIRCNGSAAAVAVLCPG